VNRHEFDIYLELYKRGEFGRIPIGKYPDGSYFYMTDKQVQTCELIADDQTLEVGYGGSARGGKSIVECTIIIFDCFAYPGIAWGLCRKKLVVLKKTVLKTLYNQFNFYGIALEKDYKFDGELHIFTFKNKSEIFLIDTAFQPSDPLNTRFGGFELTRAAIDESNETDKETVNKIFERTGWRLNDVYGLKRKVFECFNPAKNHIYTRYYKPYRDKRESVNRRFIPALPGDNPNPEVQKWVEDMIKTADEITIQRQIYGNFDYDDDPSTLVDYDALTDMFTNTHVIPGDKRISADLAMQGRDRFLAVYWRGLVGSFEIDKEKSSGKSIETDLTRLKTEKGVGNTRIIADADGLGNYLESYINNIYEFRGGARASDPGLYDNLKSELAWLLAERINKREIYIICTEDQQEKIKEEISICLKRQNLDGDTQKRKLVNKEMMKQLIGRSPDFLDVLIMGMHAGRRVKKGMKAL